MSGIAAYGVKIPKRRIDAESIWKVWKNVSHEILDKLGMKERAVTGPDEDPITLGADSARRCLAQWGKDVKEIDGLIFASGTNPYCTKAAATVLQDILGLRHNIFVTDVQCAARSGFDGIRIATALINSGACHNVMVVASDCLNQYMSPGHVYEYAASAGAVSVVISDSDVVAQIEDIQFASQDRANWFRLSGDRYMQLGAGFVGYISNWGLMDEVKEAWQTYAQKNGKDPADFEHCALPQGTVVQCFMSTGAIGNDVYSAIPYVLSESVGDMGCASVLASLCGILDLIDDGDQHILATCYGWGDGAAVMGLTTTEKIGNLPDKMQVMTQIDNKEMIEYAKALKYEKKLDRNTKGLSSYY